MIHLYTLGYRNEDLINFNIKLNNPSKISELQEIEHFKAQLEVASSAKEVGFSKRWIFENIFKMNDRDFSRVQRDIFYDKQYEKSIESGETSSDAAAAGGTATVGTSEPTPTEGEAAAAAEAPTSEPGAEATPEAPEETGEESTLLAAPARRADGSETVVYKKDGSYKTEGSNNTYYKQKKVDGRERAGFRKSDVSAGLPETAVGNTQRSRVHIPALRQAAKGIFNESSQDVYKNDEKLILEMENKLKSLSKALLKEDNTLENK